ncbi:MAG: hypothetical protein O7G87_18470 [bacterium]|nr:hypothetical protein [bacterium]
MFHSNTNGTLYNFETDLLQGTIQPGGHRHGIRKLIHKPSGLQLVHPDFALLNLYLLLAQGQCLASARSIYRTVTLQNNTIRIHWEPTPLHRAGLDLTYQWVNASTLDLTITVSAHENYPAYEAFLASYFDLALRPYICTDGGSYSKEPHWHTPVLQQLHRNNALVFPRDAEAGRLHLDGRWRNVRSIYLWKSEQYYAYPLAIQAHPDQQIAVVLMAHPETCPAVCWTVGLADVNISSYQSDHLDDPYKARNPLYLSLFGQDLQPRDKRTARVRLAVIELDKAMEHPIEVYKAFINETSKK